MRRSSLPRVPGVSVLLSAACGRSSALVDGKLYGPWQHRGAGYQDERRTKTGIVDGDIDPGRGGECRGARHLGRIAAPPDGPYTVPGNQPTLGAGSDVTYTWPTAGGEGSGVPVRILALDNGTPACRSVRKRRQQAAVPSAPPLTPSAGSARPSPASAS